jgi:hypothetical protein
MDNALPAPPPVDRRTLVAIVLAGATGAVLAETGDSQTAGHATALVATAQRDTGRRRGALSTARKAHAAAGNRPAGVLALLDTASIAAKMGNRDAVFDAVTEAEKAHARLSHDQWGTTPGYPFGTVHPARVKTFGGAALAAAGLYGEAAARLDEATQMLAGTTVGSLWALVLLTQAGVALGTGDLDAARNLAGVAVASEQARPSGWVASRIADFDERSRGAFADLAEQTRGWGMPVRTSPSGI